MALFSTGLFGGVETANASNVFADITITQRDINDASPLQFSLTGTGSDTLNPPTGYTQITEFEDNVSKGGFVFDGVNDEIIIPVDGWYQADGWSDFRHSQNNSTIAFVFGFRQNDTDPFGYSQRPTANKKPNNDDIGQISGGGVFYATAGTRLSVHMATNNTGTVTVPNANLRIWAQRLGSM